MTPLYTIRKAVAEDGNFIRDAWRRSYSHSPWSRTFDPSLYHPVQRGIIERLLARSAVMVAHLPDDTDALYGFAVVEGPTAHYVYVKPANRVMGIAKALVKAGGGGVDVRFASHDTRIAPGHASRAVAVDDAILSGLEGRRASSLFGLQFCPAFVFMAPSEVE